MFIARVFCFCFYVSNSLTDFDATCFCTVQNMRSGFELLRMRSHVFRLRNSSTLLLFQGVSKYHNFQLYFSILPSVAVLQL
jgi:hypothetical protein